MSSVKKEIKQRGEFETRQQEAIVGLLLTTDRLKGRLSELAAQFEITPQQYNVLRILRGAGEGGLSTLEVTGRMIERNPGITRLLDRLEAKSLIHRERSAGDRRRQICRITPEGTRVLTDMDRPMRDLTQDVMNRLSDKDVDRLLELLFLVRSGI